MSEIVLCLQCGQPCTTCTCVPKRASSGEATANRDKAAWISARAGVNVAQAGIALIGFGFMVWVYLLVTSDQLAPTRGLVSRLASLGIIAGFLFLMLGQGLSCQAPVKTASPWGLTSLILTGLAGLFFLIGFSSESMLAGTISMWSFTLGMLCYGYFMLQLAKALGPKKVRSSWQGVMALSGIAIALNFASGFFFGLWIVIFMGILMLVLFLSYLVALSHTYRAIGQWLADQESACLG